MQVGRCESTCKYPVTRKEGRGRLPCHASPYCHTTEYGPTRARLTFPSHSPRSVAVDTPGRRLGARAAPVGVDGRVGGHVGRRGPVRTGAVARRHEVAARSAPLFADAVLRHETLRVAAADQVIKISVAGTPPLGHVAPSSSAVGAATRRRRCRRGVICLGNYLARFKSGPVSNCAYSLQKL